MVEGSLISQIDSASGASLMLPSKQSKANLRKLLRPGRATIFTFVHPSCVLDWAAGI